jgi:hypothetical protein
MKLTLAWFKQPTIIVSHAISRRQCPTLPPRTRKEHSFKGMTSTATRARMVEVIMQMNSPKAGDELTGSDISRMISAKRVPESDGDFHAEANHFAGLPISGSLMATPSRRTSIDPPS